MFHWKMNSQIYLLYSEIFVFRYLITKSYSAKNNLVQFILARNVSVTVKIQLKIVSDNFG